MFYPEDEGSRLFAYVGTLHDVTSPEDIKLDMHRVQNNAKYLQ
jgi:hypothetical protein